MSADVAMPGPESVCDAPAATIRTRERTEAVAHRIGPLRALVAPSVPCDLWGGHPSGHQEEAQRVIGRVPPFSWALTTCENKLCVERAHLVVRQPQSLGYQNGICIYCGFMAVHRDHLLPEPWSGPTMRGRVLTVPSCRECNIGLSDLLTFSITERRAHAHEYIRRRHRKWMRCKEFTRAELAEMGPNLRSTVTEGMQRRAATLARLAWPEDPFYDLNAITSVGIENPYVIGMITPPEGLT